MQAVVLAGGLATRLGARTRELPKSLLEVAGRPFVAWQLERLQASGFAEVVLCVGHLGKQIEAFVGDGRRFALEVRYSYDGPRLLGTAGALKKALPLLSEHFLVTYGDSYLPFDYAAPLRDLEAHSNALGTLSVFRNRGQWDASNARVTKEWVVAYDKHATPNDFEHIDYGATALRRTALHSVPAAKASGFDELLHELAKARKLRAFEAVRRFYEIGSEGGLAELAAYLTRKPS